MRFKRALLALPVLLLPSPAFALLCGTVLDPMSVSVTPLAFGYYFPVSTSSNSVTVNVSCGLLGVDVLPSFAVSLSSGNATSPASRYMDKSGAHLNYNVYTTQSYAKVWGDGTSGSLTQSYNALLSLGTISFTGHGRVPSGQYVAPGSYTDRLTVTINY